MFRTLIDRVPLFSLLSNEGIEELLVITRSVSFSPGDSIIIQGSHLDNFYILLDGKVELISKLREGDESDLTVRGPGDFFGEIELLIPERVFSISAKAITYVQALEVSYSDFSDLFTRRPNLGYGILQGMIYRSKLADVNILQTLRSENRRLTRINFDFNHDQTEILEPTDMEREMQVARRIQKGILPRKLPQLSGFDFGVRMAQARAVGGDFFDFIPLSRDTIGIAIGDVSDKGVPASIFMAVTRSLLRAEAHNGILPRHVLQRVNYHLMDMNELGLFVTVLYGVLNAVDRTFRYARAGHEIPLIFDENCSANCIEPGHGQALGIFSNPQFDETQISFSPNSILLLNTDGVTDAINQDGVAFGIERLSEVVKRSKNDSAQYICDNVIDSITAFVGTTPQFDDLTLVGIKSG